MFDRDLKIELSAQIVWVYPPTSTAEEANRVSANIKVRRIAHELIPQIREMLLAKIAEEALKE